MFGKKKVQATLYGNILRAPKHPYFKSPTSAYEIFINTEWLKSRCTIKHEFLKTAITDWKEWGKAASVCRPTKEPVDSCDTPASSTVPTRKPFFTVLDRNQKSALDELSTTGNSETPATKDSPTTQSALRESSLKEVSVLRLFQFSIKHTYILENLSSYRFFFNTPFVKHSRVNDCFGNSNIPNSKRGSP